MFLVQNADMNNKYLVKRRHCHVSDVSLQTEVLKKKCLHDEQERLRCFGTDYSCEK